MLKKIAIDRIKPNPFCPRQKTSASMSAEVIGSLAKEIERVGWWGPALPARQNGGYYEAAFGRRRLAALKKLGHKTVELDVQDLTDEKMKLLSAVENFQRHGLTDEERAIVWKHMLELCEGRTQEAAKLLGIDRMLAAALNDVVEYEEKQSKKGTRKKGSRRSFFARALRAAKNLGAVVGEAEAEQMIEAAEEHEWTQKFIDAVHAEINRVAEKTHVPKKTLVQAMLDGEIESVKDVKAIAREIQMEAFDKDIKHAKKTLGPPDLLEVIADWCENLPEIIEKIQEVASLKEYADYIIEGDPKLASQFKKLLGQLVAAAHKLETNIVPRLQA